MEKAKAAVASFTSKRGHTTDVVESVAPAVVDEHIKPLRHEEIQEAVDREVHQDHYHTTIQPIQHQEVLPEQHHHKMAPVISKEFHHGNEHEIRQRLEAEAAQFKNSTITHETRHTTAAAARVEGEHVHHHVHETVQPIVHKEIITPEVVHTTIPIHEEHHAAAQVHGVSTLPMKTLNEFTSHGGILEGGHTSAHETYEGPPRPYNRELMTNPTEADLEPGRVGLGSGAHHTGGTGIGSSTNGTAGPHHSNLENKLDPRVDSDLDGRRGVETGRSGNSTAGMDRQFGEVGNTTRDNDLSNTSTNGSGSKPSLVEKIKRVL